MSGVGILFILLLVSSIPAIAVFIWFRFARYPFSPVRFLVSLLAGAASLFPALFLQNMFPAGSGILYVSGKWGIFVEIFVRIAFTEELSRFLILIILFCVFRRFSRPAVQPEQSMNGQQDPLTDVNISALTMAGATGLVAGLGFAIFESAIYGAANPGNVLLRAFTAAPLHGACGFRVGSSIEMVKKNPVQGISRFLSAALIHGVYNFMIIIPGSLTSVAAVLIALSGLATAILGIRTGMGEQSTV